MAHKTPEIKDPAAELLAEVEKFMLDHDMRPSTFSALALRERHFVARLRKGAPVMSSNIVRVRTFMATYRPTRPRAPNARGYIAA